MHGIKTLGRVGQNISVLGGGTPPVPPIPFEGWAKRFEFTTVNTKVLESIDVLCYDLAEAPALFWSSVRVDGGDIRVASEDGSTEFAREVVGFDKVNNKGFVFFKQSGLSTSEDTTFRMYYGKASATHPEPDAVNGRESVWPSEFKGVWHLLDGFKDSTANGFDLTPVGQIGRFEQTGVSPDIGSHQGVAYDGTYYYPIGTDRLTKRTSGWGLQAENTDPVADAITATGEATLNHQSDAHFYNGRLYVPIEYWNGCEDRGNTYICEFSTTDLSFISATAIPFETDFAFSSIVYREDIDEFICTDYCIGTRLIRLDPTDYSLLGYIDLSETIQYVQGITWDGSQYILSESGTDALWKVHENGTVIGKVYSHGSGLCEGVTMKGTDLLLLVDPGSLEQIFTLEPKDGMYFEGVDAHFKVTLGAQIDAAYMDCFWRYDTIQQMGLLSYADESTAGNDRVTLAFDDGTHIAAWDSVNSWLDPVPEINPTINTWLHSGAYLDLTTRKFVHAGEEKATEAIASRPVDLDTFYIGTDDKDNNDNFAGEMRFVRLRSSYPSENARLTEFNNMNDPSSFWTTGSEADNT